LIFYAMKSFAAGSIRTLVGWSMAPVAVFWVNLAVAQNPAAQVPTTVQLPTFHYFTSTGTVLVPDGGEAFLGGISGSTAGRSEQGIPGLPSRPFTNSAIGSSTSAGNVSVSAQIHDFEALDQALLGKTGDDVARSSLAGNRLLAATKLGPEPLVSVATIRAQLADADAAGDKLAAAALASGREMLTAGKLGVARIYFESAAKQASPNGEVHRQAVAALEQVRAPVKIAGQ
jgi:hypothetical protein